MNVSEKKYLVKTVMEKALAIESRASKIARQTVPANGRI